MKEPICFSPATSADASLVSAPLAGLAEGHAGGVAGDDVAGELAPVLRGQFHGFVAFFDLPLRLQHGADDEVQRLPGADGIERRADLPALVLEAVAGGAGEFRAAVHLRAVPRIAARADFLHQLGHKLRRRPQLAGGRDGGGDFQRDARSGRGGFWGTGRALEFGEALASLRASNWGSLVSSECFPLGSRAVIAAGAASSMNLSPSYCAPSRPYRWAVRTGSRCGCNDDCETHPRVGIR